METTNSPNELEIFDINEQEILYQGLLSLILSGSNVGIVNGDRFHPVYLLEYNGDASNYPFDTYRPESDIMFNALKKLSQNLIKFDNIGKPWFKPILSWRHYQELIGIANEKMNTKPKE